MIRSFTLVCGLAAAAATLYLYQTKHDAQVLDRQIGQIMRTAEATKARIAMLRAEYELLNDPTRLQDLADKYLALRPTAPGQFTIASELARRLPPVDLTPPAPPPDDTGTGLFELPPSPPPAPLVAIATPPVAPKPPAAVPPRPVPMVAQAAPARPLALASTKPAARAIIATPRPAPRAVAAVRPGVPAQLQQVSATRPMLPAAPAPTFAPAPSFVSAPTFVSALGMARSLIRPVPAPPRAVDGGGR